MLPVKSTVSLAEGYIMSAYGVIVLLILDNAIAGLVSDSIGRVIDIVFGSVLGKAKPRVHRDALSFQNLLSNSFFFFLNGTFSCVVHEREHCV